MKKLLVLLFVGLLTISCSSNDDETFSNDPIIGSWRLTSIIKDGTDLATTCDKRQTATFDEEGKVSITNFSLDSNGTCSISETRNGTWSPNGNSYSITFDGETDTETLSFSGNNLSFVSEGATYTYTKL